MPILAPFSLVRDLAIDFGIPYSLVLTVNDMDLTGATASVEISKGYGYPPVAVFLTTIDVISTVQSELTLELNSAGTVGVEPPVAGTWVPNKFKPGNWRWNIRFDYSDPEKPPEYFLGGVVSVQGRR
jgi:hypothetical protein